MSFMRGDLLTKTRKLVNGLVIARPEWLKAMEENPPVIVPGNGKGKLKRKDLPEDIYVKRFYKKYPDSLYQDPIRVNGFDPPPARVYAWRVLELKEQGVSEEDAVAAADVEYRAEKKEKKQAHKRLKEIARLQGTKPPPNPFPSPIKEIQAEERYYIRERFFNPRIRRIVEDLKEERRAEQQDRWVGK